jgi:hypothetical protein
MGEVERGDVEWFREGERGCVVIEKEYGGE